MWSTGNKLTYSLCVFLMMMAITFTFASMYEIPEVEGFLMNKKLFGLILGVLVGFFTSLLYFFFLLPQLLKMKGDLRISFSVFSKRKENPPAGKGNSTEIIEMMEDRDSLEISPSAWNIISHLQTRIVEDGGAGLIADYGHQGDDGDTLRAFARHKQVHPLQLPGTADITADVDFSLLRAQVRFEV